MIRSAKDFWAGLIYVFFGAAAIVIARDYPMGTALRMGPAYFPSLLGALLLLIGAISIIRVFFCRGTAIGGFALKGLALVIVSVAALRLYRARRRFGGRIAAARRDQRPRQLAVSAGTRHSRWRPD